MSQAARGPPSGFSFNRRRSGRGPPFLFAPEGGSDAEVHAQGVDRPFDPGTRRGGHGWSRRRHAVERRAGASADAARGQSARRRAGEQAACADDARGEAAADPAAARFPGHRRRRAQWARVDPERDRSGTNQGAPAARGRGVAVEDPAALRLRHDPRLPDDLPDSARRGRQLRPGGCLGRRDLRGARVGRRRPQADVCPDGRRLARASVGADLRGRRRGSVPERRHGGGARQGIPGLRLRCAGQARLQPQALRRLRPAGERARLQHHRHVGAAAPEPVPAAVQGGARRWSRHVHVLVQRAERRAGLREPLPAERHPQG